MHLEYLKLLIFDEMLVRSDFERGIVGKYDIVLEYSLG